MNTHFYKYQGAGNDFVIMDYRGKALDNISFKRIHELCDRRFGIGADGLMLITEHPEYDFEMLYYNADGNPGSLCGNGGRCIVAFAKYLGIIETETNFLAVDGPHYAKISESGDWVELQMLDVDTVNRNEKAYELNTGSPQYVLPTDSLEALDVYKEGKAVRNSERYKKEGVNVNFVEDQGEQLFVRTFERGVEDETFACGTGSTASALAMAKHKKLTGHIETSVKVLGGNMKINFDYDGIKFTNVFLCGPANKVFEGNVEF
jgi:diaminopimelate epimerase